MTRDEIMAMSAEQLRVAIAEKLGYENVRQQNRIGFLGKSKEDGFYYDIPDYPNDIAAAWELVEDWHDKGEVESIDYVASDGIRSMVYSCSLRHSHIYATAPTAPLAISRAWLMWSEEVQNA